MDYDLVITNGILLGAEGETQGDDVAIRGETIAAVGPGLAAGARNGAEILGCVRAICHSGRHRCARPSRASLLRNGLQRRLEHWHPRGGSGRRDDRDRLRHPLWRRIADASFRELDGPGQAQGVRRLLLPHGDHQLGSPRPRDAKNGRHGLPDLQGIHDLCFRGLAVGRPRHL